METELIKLDNMILIGAAGQNSGKTTFATELIGRWRQEVPIIALKITSVDGHGPHCVRGNHGCGACSSLKGDYELVEEINPCVEKDTSKLLAAGAHKVYWLKCVRSHLQEGLEEFLRLVPPNALILCESNGLRNLVHPGLFIMLQNSHNPEVKPSAKKVIDKADLVIVNDFGDGLRQAAEKIRMKKGASGIEIGLQS